MWYSVAQSTRCANSSKFSENRRCERSCRWIGTPRPVRMRRLYVAHRTFRPCLGEAQACRCKCAFSNSTDSNVSEIMSCSCPACCLHKYTDAVTWQQHCTFMSTTSTRPAGEGSDKAEMPLQQASEMLCNAMLRSVRCCFTQVPGVSATPWLAHTRQIMRAAAKCQGTLSNYPG